MTDDPSADFRLSHRVSECPGTDRTGHECSSCPTIRNLIHECVQGFATWIGDIDAIFDATQDFFEVTRLEGEAVVVPVSGRRDRPSERIVGEPVSMSDLDAVRGRIRYRAFQLALQASTKATRRRKITARMPESDSDREEGPIQRIEAAERRLLVREAMELLPEAQAVAVDLRIVRGLTYREIEEQLGISTKTIRYHLDQATITLQKRLCRIVA